MVININGFTVITVSSSTYKPDKLKSAGYIIIGAHNPHFCNGAMRHGNSKHVLATAVAHAQYTCI